MIFFIVHIYDSMDIIEHHNSKQLWNLFTLNIMSNFSVRVFRISTIHLKTLTHTFFFSNFWFKKMSLSN